MTARDDIEAVAACEPKCHAYGIGCVCSKRPTLTEALTRVLGCHPGTRENDGTPCASGLHSPALWGADGCTWVAEVAECLGELS
jgi:hypothetical protein